MVHATCTHTGKVQGPVPQRCYKVEELRMHAEL